MVNSAALRERAGGRTVREIVSSARKGDQLAREALAETGWWLGLGLASLSPVFSPDRIVVGGGISSAGDILLDPHLYMAGPADIRSLLPTVRANAETVMIVGHNPGLEQLVEQLTGERQDLPTAALAQMSLPIDQWRQLTPSTRGTLVGLWGPEELT